MFISRFIDFSTMKNWNSFWSSLLKLFFNIPRTLTTNSRNSLITIEKSATPKRITKAPVMRSLSETGWKSPKPTVDSVVSAK